MKFQLHRINSRFCEEDNGTDRDAGNFLGAPRGRSDTGCNDYDRAEKVMAFLLFRAAATTCGIVVFEWGSAPDAASIFKMRLALATTWSQ